MSLEKIREAIVSKAEKEKAEIIEKAKRDCEERIQTARIAIKGNIEGRLKKLEEELQEEINRQIISLNLEQRLRILGIKNRIIDDIFTQAVDRILNQGNERYVAMLEKWLLEIDTTLPGRLFLNPRDLKRIDQAFMDRINRSRRNGARIDLDKDPVDIKGGLIFKTDKFEIDKTLDAIAAHLRREMTPMIARELFHEE